MSRSFGLFLRSTLSRSPFLSYSSLIPGFGLSTSVRALHTTTCMLSDVEPRLAQNSRRNNGVSSRSYDSEVDFGMRRKNVPVMDMVELSDEAGKGSMVRAVYFGRCVELAHYPQLGPRKTDPNDPLPQFDYKQRAFFRLNKLHISHILALCEGKTSSVELKTAFGGILSATMTGMEILHITLRLPRSQDTRGVLHEVTLSFKGHYLPSFQAFLEFSLEKSFGFENSPVSVLQQAARAKNNSTHDGRNRTANKQQQQQQQQQQTPKTQTSERPQGEDKKQHQVPQHVEKNNNNEHIFKDEIDW